MTTTAEIHDRLDAHEDRLKNLEEGQELVQDGITSIHASLAAQDGRLDTIESNSTQVKDGIVTLLSAKSNGKTNLAVLAESCKDILTSKFGLFIAIALFVAVGGAGALPTVLPFLGYGLQSPVTEMAPEAVEGPVEASEVEEAPEAVPDPPNDESPVLEDEAPVPEPEATEG